MPDSIDLAQPGTATEQDRRARLRELIAAIAIETSRVQGLSGARDRAQSELREYEREHRARLEQLETAKYNDPIEAAYKYANNDLIGLNHKHDVEQAELQVGKVQANLDRLNEIITALDSEIAAAEQRLRRLQSSRSEVMAVIVADSPEWEALIEAQRACWRRLRTLRRAAELVDKSLTGNLPQRARSNYQAAEPLEHDLRGYPLDDSGLPEIWAAALAALREDADMTLPNGGM